MSFSSCCSFYFYFLNKFSGYSGKGGGKGDKIANGGRSTVFKEPQPLELKVEQGGYLEVCFWFKGIIFIILLR